MAEPQEMDTDRQAEDRDREEEDDGEDNEGENEDENEDDEEEDEDEDEEEEEDEEDDQAGQHKSNKRSGGQLGSAKRKRGKYDKSRSIISRLFDIEAEHGDSEEEDEGRGPTAGAEVIVQEDERQAIEAVQRRHAQNREFLGRDAAALAAEYQRKAREERSHRINNLYYDSGTGIGSSIASGKSLGAVLQQSLLPSVSDPCIWRFKVRTGSEQEVVEKIMRKAIDSRMRGGPLRIKSAFYGAKNGYVYVEGMAEPLTREAITGLRGIFGSSMKLVPVQEMTSLLTVTANRNPLAVGQWVRISRGPLKGDLARITALYEGGDKVMIQAVPRPDYSGTTNNANNAGAGGGAGGDGTKGGPGGAGSKKAANMAAAMRARPPQRLFEVSEVLKHGGESFRRFHPDDRSSGSYYEFWQNEYYKDGFLFKVVNPATFLKVNDVKPRVEEQKLFLTHSNKANKSSKMGDDDDDAPGEEEEEESDLRKSQSLLTDLAADMHAHVDPHTGLPAPDSSSGATGTKLKAAPYVVGDLVQVVSGELRNLVGKVVRVNELQRSVTITPLSGTGGLLTGEFQIEIPLLVKYVEAKSHVKVIAGAHMGQTGQVVCVNVVEGRPVCVIITDGVNTEILVDVDNVQVSTEVTTGLGSLNGYELYDLVSVNDSENAVVIYVGAEKLTVKNHMDEVKDVYPQELQGKRNNQSTRSSGFDKNQNSVYVGDVVNVIDGVYAKKSGTIKHIMKGTLWLHISSVLKHSGIVAVRARSCVVAGVNKKPTTLGVINAPTTAHSHMGPPTSHVSNAIGNKLSGMNKPNPKAARDASVGITVRITKGQYKGMLAQVVDASGDSYTVELLARFKKITIDKASTVPVGDKGGSLDPKKRVVAGGLHELLPDTSYLVGDTPSHFGMHDTPRRSYGDATPSSATPSSAYYGNNSYYGEATPLAGSMTPSGGGRGDSVWAVSERDVVRSHQQQSSGGAGQGDYDYSYSSRGSANPYDTGSAHGGAGSSRHDPWALGSDTHSSPSNSVGGGGRHSAHSVSVMGDGSSPSSSITYSPYGAQTSPVGPTASSGGGGNNLSLNDWVVNMLVTFKYGPNAGKTGIVSRLPDERGRRCSVSVRDANGRYSSAPTEVDCADVVPAAPAKKMRVCIVGGNLRGKTGTIQNMAGGDLIVAIDGSSGMELIKTAHAVCVAQ